MKTIPTLQRKWTWKTVFPAAAIALLAVLAPGCKHKTAPVVAAADSASKIGNIASGAGTAAAIHIADGTNVSVNGGSGYAHVTYAPAVKTFDHAEVASALEGIGSDGHGFLFQNAPDNIKSLKAGDVFLVKGEMAGKVVGVDTEGTETLVVLDQPSITDLVDSGEIELDAPIRFTGPKQAANDGAQPLIEKVMDMMETPVYAQSGLSGSSADAARDAGTTDALKKAAGNMKDAITSGWKVTQYSFTPSDSQCNFQIVLVKQTQGFVARVAMKGWISNFDFSSKLDLTSPNAGKSGLSKAFSSVKNMKGNIQFDWEIGKESPGVWAEEDRVKLPGGISVPLAPLLGGLPLTLDVSSALLIHPALTGGNEYSRGGFSINWGGPGGGFQTTSSGAVNDNDQSNTINLAYNVTADQNISPVAPNAMVISYCAPRIELRLDVLGPFASSVKDFGSNIDNIVTKMESKLPQNILDALAKSPLSKVTASNILASNADVFVQFIATEGVTHSSSVTPAPCSKQQIKFTGQGGASAQFFGLTDSAKKTTDFFTKEYTRWDPPSDFCKSVGA